MFLSTNLIFLIIIPTLRNKHNMELSIRWIRHNSKEMSAYNPTIDKTKTCTQMWSIIQYNHMLRCWSLTTMSTYFPHFLNVMQCYINKQWRKQGLRLIIIIFPGIICLIRVVCYLKNNENYWESGYAIFFLWNLV